MTHLKDNPGPETTLPDIDCVIIGVNCRKTLGRCLESVQAADYPTNKLHIFYVDGGSTDDSLAIAAGFPGVTAVSLNPEFPTPGLGRNAGWKQGCSSLVQFLDSDTLLAPGWLKTGVDAMNAGKIGAVQGLRQELRPEQSVYNWIASLEWNGPAGQTDCFGGDVLVRRTALEVTGGYDEVLVGGEDPELSRRIGRAGWKILQLSAPMTGHDLAMTRVRAYLQRAYRSGYGFAAVRAREARQNSLFWQPEMRKIVIRGGGFILLSLLGLLLLLAGGTAGGLAGLFCLLAASAALCRPRLCKVKKFMQLHGLTRPQGRTYAWHCSLAVLPQFFGVLRFYWGDWFNRPLRNQPRRLATGTSPG